MNESNMSFAAESSRSRPHTPDSPLTNSLHQATATIDDITAALSNFSRAPTPDPPNLLRCCCSRDECEHTKAWLAFKTKLEGRLILSAEVGQALLRKHEAYVRRHEPLSRQSQNGNDRDRHMDRQVGELLKENATLEKRLNAALVNSEVGEAENKTILKELLDAKSTITRLTAYQAKSLGWDIRLSAAVQEMEDVRQERDSERTRAKVAETKVAALMERCAKLQSDIRHCYEDLEQQKQSRTELSEEILRDARARLEMLQQSQLGHTISTMDVEITQVMESLVADNEALKRDNAELQNILSESREDVRSLREEVEETRASISPMPEDNAKIGFSGPGLDRHHHASSWQSSFGYDRLIPLSPRLHLPGSPRSSPNNLQEPSGRRELTGNRRPQSVGPSSRHSYEPLTPETQLRPLSPAELHGRSEVNYPPFSSPQPHYPESHVSFEVDSASQRANTPDSPEKPKGRRKPLILLTQNRGVQTDEWVGLLGASLRPSAFSDNPSSLSAPDGRSESSSLADGNASTIAALVDRVTALYNRIAQADALTLTNRLKRQRLTGADVGHISRSTVGGILTEVAHLRNHFRAVLEDDKVLSTCTRKDLRALLKLFKDIFNELGQMRIALNEVILDPSTAVKVREAAMNPSKGADLDRGRASARGSPALGGWMAPISKLFGSAAPQATDTSSEDASAPLSRKATGRTPMHPRRLVPKLEPALGASATTVNVEFSGAGIGRAVSSTATAVAGRDSALSASSSSRTIMGIFAGAPGPRPSRTDPWVVIPTGALRARAPTMQAATSPDMPNAATLGRSARMSINRLSRNVDAVIDAESAVHDEESDFPATLLERTLRPRGLSDSSIHSTFLSAGGSEPLPVHAASARQAAYPDRHSVLRTLSRKVHSFAAQGSAPGVSELSYSPPRSTPTAADPVQPVSSPKMLDLLPNLAAWGAGLDREMTEDFVGSVREDAAFHRTWARKNEGRNM